MVVSYDIMEHHVQIIVSQELMPIYSVYISFCSFA